MASKDTKIVCMGASALGLRPGDRVEVRPHTDTTYEIVRIQRRGAQGWAAAAGMRVRKVSTISALMGHCLFG